MSDFVTSVIRTIVPVIVASVVSFFSTKDAVLSAEEQAQLTAGLTTLFTLLYYGFARVLESRFPKLGFLLGVPKQPKY